MKDDTVVALRQPESFSDDPLTEILRAGARQLLGQAIEAEVAAHIEAHADFDRSYVRKLVTEISGGVFGYLDSVLERHSFDEFGELI